LGERVEAYKSSMVRNQRQRSIEISSYDLQKYTRSCYRTWVAMTQYGFTRKMLKTFIGFLVSKDIWLVVHKMSSDGKYFEDMIGEEIQFFANNRPLRKVSCLQIDLNGDFLSATVGVGRSSAGEVEDGSRLLQPQSSALASRLAQNVESAVAQDYSKLFHCVALYPPVSKPAVEHLVGNTGRSVFQSKFRKACDTSKFGNFHPVLSMSSLFVKEIIKCQHSRIMGAWSFFRTGSNLGNSFVRESDYEVVEAPGVEDKVAFLEVGEGDEVVEDDLERNEGLGFREGRSARECLFAVLAYDMETVENLRGCQDKVASRFKKDPPSVLLVPEHLRSIYDVPEGQIPYSVQFGFVDMSQTRAHQSSDRWEQEAVIIDGKGVQICYGKDGLGDCVDQFLSRAYDDANLHGFTHVYCYAHNACAFDSYLVLKYMTLPFAKIRKILVTPRGILNLTIAMEDTSSLQLLNSISLEE